MIETHLVTTNGIELNVAEAGDGPLVVLLHGFPHTWQVWTELIGPLARHHRVLAPDLRGFGDSTRTALQPDTEPFESAPPDAGTLDAGPLDAGTLDAGTLDAGTIAADIAGLIGDRPATVIAIDAAVPAAFLLGLTRPELVTRLVLIESTLGRLPGADDFYAAGPPWWFGFHAVPDLAETVLAGHEAEYVGWFYDQGTRNRGVRPDIRSAFGAAYSRPGALRSALGVYRALPRTIEQLAEATHTHCLTVPTTAIGAAPVGRALEHQLRPITDNLTSHLIPDCGHIVPLDRPHELLAALDLEAPTT
ncbi:MAG TPA: alpha/beta hydrolase [Kribbella sp.]